MTRVVPAGQDSLAGEEQQVGVDHAGGIDLAGGEGAGRVAFAADVVAVQADADIEPAYLQVTAWPQTRAAQQ